MAIDHRRPEKGLLFHSDRGSQYTSFEFRKNIDELGFIQSMSRKGNCWDNACAESFFGHMKREIGIDCYGSRDEAKAEIFDYIERYYSRRRMHRYLDYLDYLDYLAPEEF